MVGQTMLLEGADAPFIRVSIVLAWPEHREIEDAQVEWCGSIKHVASGSVKYLTDLDEIARFIVVVNDMVKSREARCG